MPRGLPGGVGWAVLELTGTLERQKPACATTWKPAQTLQLTVMSQ